MTFPKPRYEVRQMARAAELWSAWDTERMCFVMAAQTQWPHEAERTVAALNREYQRWLADRDNDRAERGP